MTVKPYPGYKASGVEWLASIPETWSVERIRRRARLRTDKAVDASLKVALENVQSWTGRFIDTEEADYSGEGIAFSRGDVLFGKLRPYLAKAWRADTEGAAIGDFHVYSLSSDTDPRFFQFMILSGDFISLVDGSTYGAKMPRASWDFIGNLMEAFPPIAEQRQIADYLDIHTAKIDLLIGKQERLIETLAERRQAVISHAVTKGLDPNVPMKDSGIYWLGEVPDTWTVIPLKRSLKFLTSGSRGWAEYYSDSGVPFIRIGNLPRGSLGLAMDDTQFVQIPGGAEGSRSVVREGDVLFSITAYLGSVAIVDSANRGSYVSQHVALARLNRRLAEPRFVGYFVLSESGQRQLQEQGYGGTKIQLSLDDIRHLVVTIPPIGEQLQIVEYLDRETAQIDALSVMAREMIKVLRERRQALISAAVTGKIDVRGLS